MALLAFEGFDYFNAGSDLGNKPKWAMSAGYSVTQIAGFGSVGGAAQMINQAGRAFVITPGSTYGTLVAGQHYKTSAFVLTPIIQFNDGGSSQCGLGMTAAGKLIFYRGTTGTIVATGTTTLLTNTWYYFEIKVTFSTSGNSDGSYEIRIDGNTELIATGTADTTATANATASAVQLGNSQTAQTTAMDNFYFCDSSGSVANTFLGSPRVETLFVTSNNSVVFTPLSSTNSSNVDETSMDSDTSYNSSHTSGDIDTFNHGSLSLTPTTIYGVEVVMAARKDDTTAQTVRTKLISGVTTSNGTSYTPSTVYQTFSDMYLTDPNTAGVAWIATNVNSSKIGYEHV